MKPQIVFAVLGGDMRQVRLAELLAEAEYTVRCFGMEKANGLRGCCRCLHITEALTDADCVILPLPVQGREGCLNAPLSEDTYFLDSILREIPREALVCAGRIDPKTAALMRELRLDAVDYYEREELAVGNAIATAEGAIQLAMEETAITLMEAKVLVIGYGRIGKVLSHRLRGLGADVTVSARKHADKAWIRAYGYKAADTNELKATLGAYDIVFNTVPSMVLDEGLLAELRPECLCMDLASKPGGMDFTAASRLGVKAVWALSLPGEVAPISSGVLIRNTVLNILAERGIPI